MARVAAALGQRTAAPRLALYELAERLGAPLALADIGIDADDLSEAAELRAGGGRRGSSPRTADLARPRAICSTMPTPGCARDDRTDRREPNA